jgi:hypothetical protein
MKKISVFITAVLMMCFIIIPTNSVKAIGMDEIIKNVEQTNKQINDEIEKAVYAAQEAFDVYNHDLMVLLKDKELSKIDQEISQIQNNLKSIQVSSEEYEAMVKRIEKGTQKKDDIGSRYENKSSELKNTLNGLILELNISDLDNRESEIIEVDIRKTLEEYSNLPNKNDEKIQKLEESYIAEIDKIIENLLDVTNKLATKMIEDAAKEGVIVYCDWVEVTLGGRVILVDPLRIGNY